MSQPSILLAMAVLGLEGREGAPMATDVVPGNNRFAVELFGRLRDRPGNLFLSPCSISSALGMTYAGARGEMAGEMARVHHLDGEPDEVHKAFGSLMRSLQADEG